MALKLGTENKKQVIAVVVLFTVVLGVGGYEIYGMFSGPATPVRPPVTAQKTAPATTSHAAATGTQSSGPDAQKLNGSNIDPTLHLDKLAMSEDVEYAGTGRNIFSADSGPSPQIEAQLASARNNAPPVVIQPAPPERPKPPPIELKYFGYTQDRNKSIEAFFVRGDDVFIAKSGEVVDHRYKIGAIQPANVDVTDLGYNNTQNLPLTAN